MGIIDALRTDYETPHGGDDVIAQHSQILW